jgi:hypothetical protein
MKTCSRVSPSAHWLLQQGAFRGALSGILLANSLCWAVYGWVLIVRHVEVIIR